MKTFMQFLEDKGMEGMSVKADTKELSNRVLG